VASDVETLRRLGYAQELLRRLDGFSNFAVSLSIICILAGGITSFHLGLSSVGGAAIGLGWPLACLFSLVVALAMAQVASAFPTAGGLYHWSAILGGRGWGWATAWLNLAGLVIVLAAINVGGCLFTLDSLGPSFGLERKSLHPWAQLGLQTGGLVLITFTQGLFNHLGIRVTARLIDFSGYLILVVSAALTAALLYHAPSWDLTRLVAFSNYSGERGGGVWPEASSLPWLFVLGLLLPAYTVTGFDASAHVSEETVAADRNVPRGIVRSVWVSAVGGWVLLSAMVIAIPDLDAGAAKGDQVFYWTMGRVLPPWLATALFLGIALAQYLCGLATVTSASRMLYAFARDGGLPFSAALRRVSAERKAPAAAVWLAAGLSELFTLYTPAYATITAAGTIFLYLSYALPIALGFFAYGRTWTRMGPWNLGGWYRPLAALCVVWCGALLVIGFQPPNEKAFWTVCGAVALLALG
ncbi:MAG: amino acid permease, partial [Thermoanaerobaculia bacterium]